MLSLQMYGCRVIQKALEVSSNEKKSGTSPAPSRPSSAAALLACHIISVPYKNKEPHSKMSCWVF